MNMSKEFTTVEYGGPDSAIEKNICSITGKTYEGYGNNAYPFPGICSDEANSRYVIPARLCGVTPEMVEKWGVKVVCDAIDERFFKETHNC